MSQLVRIEKPSAASFSKSLREIRSWLVERNIQPIDFQPGVTRYGFRFDLVFRTEDQAELFQREFA